MARANNLFLLSVLALAVLLAGCTTGNGTQGTPTESEGKGLQIDGPECHPLNEPEGSCSQINQYQNVIVTMTVENTGSKEIKIPFDMRHEIGSSEPYQSLSAAVLRSVSNCFSPRESSVTVDKVTPADVYTYEKVRGEPFPTIDDGFLSREELDSSLREILETAGLLPESTTSSSNLVLQPGHRLEFEWVMRLRGRTELATDYRCNLAFELKTIQTVTATRRIQIKSDRDVQDLGSFTAKSSASPMEMKLEAPNSWVVGEEAFPVQIYLENRESGSPGLRLVLEDTDIVADTGEDPPLNCEPQPSETSRLGERQLRLLQDGSGSTTKKTFLCKANPLPAGTDSETAVLSSTAIFYYNYPRKTIDITLCKQGDDC